MRISDWSSDVCSSDLVVDAGGDMRQAAVEIGGIGSVPGLCVTGGVAKRDNLVLIGDRTAANGNRVGGAGIRKGAQRSGLLVGGAGAVPDANAGQASRPGGLAGRTRPSTSNGPTT